jgi:hypothetical protein
MHAKAEQVERFIDNDLLKIVEEAFANSAAEKVESALDTSQTQAGRRDGGRRLAVRRLRQPAFANTPAARPTPRPQPKPPAK